MKVDSIFIENSCSKVCPGFISRTWNKLRNGVMRGCGCSKKNCCRYTVNCLEISEAEFSFIFGKCLWGGALFFLLLCLYAAMDNFGERMMNDKVIFSSSFFNKLLFDVRLGEKNLT